MNYWIKTIYKARGPNASWTWLEGISSCITTLRELADKVNTSLVPHNSNYHTSPNLEADLAALTKSLRDERIHTQDLGRRFRDKSFRVKDVMAAGRLALKDNGTIDVNTQGEAQAPDMEVEEKESLIEVVVDNGGGDDGDPFDIS